MSEHAHAPHPPGDGLDKHTSGKLGALETLKELSPKFAQAKAERTYLEHFRKSKKALLMIEAEKEGHKTGAMQERYAYSHPSYVELLEGLRDAVAIEERLRFQLLAAESAIRIWQTKQANIRTEHRTV